MTQRNLTSQQKTQNFRSLKEVTPRNPSQKNYLEAIDENVVTFGIGPAGTGKTFLAMYKALCYLWSKKTTGINRIILTRPAVEAGERLGFLPGIIEEKMDPFMRPLYDALYNIAGYSDGTNKIKKGVIEIAPVAFMRGRTLDDAFIILDEAQNCSWEQLKMILTRLGENVKLVISGDPNQSDLKGSGLNNIIDAVDRTNNVEVIRFQARDVERSKIVKDILTSLEKYENIRQA